jgi:hypothetical protein
MNKIYSIFALILMCLSLEASHIKAGEILVRNSTTNYLNYTFDIVLYYNDTNITTNPAQFKTKIDVTQITVNLGDGSIPQVVPLSSIIYYSGKGIAKATYTVTHTYPGSGTYKIYFSERYRIGQILNINNGSSDNINLFIDAQISINAFYGQNTAPILTAPPIDYANRRKIYTHNPGAYDVDGDSLVFELIPPKDALDKDVLNYINPENSKFNGVNTIGGPATFTIDKRTGQIRWNTPGTKGFYNIAIRIKEYRKGILLGYIVRDMQIEVIDVLNDPPVIVSLDSVCLEAQKFNQINFSVSDPNLIDKINIEDLGSGFALKTSRPIFNNLNNPVSNPYTGRITWTPSCSQVQEQPYQLIIKATDDVAPSIQLSDVKTILAKVRGPRPNWNALNIVNKNQVRLSWKPYNIDCPKNNIKINIYRSECDSQLVYDPCKIAKVISSNYELIGSINSADTFFIDNNNGKAFKNSVKYYYTLIAFFPDLQKGVSYAADIKSVTFISNNILINAVDVQAQNKIQLSWTNPNTSSLSPLFGLGIMRSTDNVNFRTIYKEVDLANITTNQYSDNDVDLTKNNYYYKIYFYQNGDTTNKTFSDVASNIILSYKPLNNSVLLTWSGVTPFNVFKTKIFSVKQNKYIDSVATDTSYTIKNLASCDSSEYLVTTIQNYCASSGTDFYSESSYKLKVAPLPQTNVKFNLAIANSYCDNAPCTQEVSLPVSDTLRWDDLKKKKCTNIVGYNVYFKSILENEYKLIGSTIDTSFVSYNTTTRVGCYQIKAIVIDENGKTTEATTSNETCINNDCYCFVLPNVITPNGDNLNDALVPMKYPRFIKNMKFIICNRWGVNVFETTNPNINWDAINVESGVYFYSAEIGRYSLDGQNLENIKGQVTVVK